GTTTLQITVGSGSPTPSSPQPRIAFDHTNPTGPAPLIEQLDATTSTCPGTWCAAFDWDFGDGSPHSSRGWVSHSYAAGNFVVSLTVTDGTGRSSAARVLITATSS